MGLMLFLKKTEVRRGQWSPPVAACRPSEARICSTILCEDMGCGVSTRCIDNINWGKKVEMWLGGEIMKVRYH